MIRLADANSRKKQFLLARTALAVTGCLTSLSNPEGALTAAVLLMVFAVLTSLASLKVDPFLYFDDSVQSMYLVVDTALVFAMLIVAEAGLSYLIPFFVVIGLTAKIENVYTLSLVGVVAAMGGALFAEHEWAGFASLPTRIPFMIATCVYYWLVVLPARASPTD